MFLILRVLCVRYTCTTDDATINRCGVCNRACVSKAMNFQHGCGVVADSSRNPYFPDVFEVELKFVPFLGFTERGSSQFVPRVQRFCSMNLALMVTDPIRGGHRSLLKWHRRICQYPRFCCPAEILNFRHKLIVSFERGTRYAVRNRQQLIVRRVDVILFLPQGRV